MTQNVIVTEFLQESNFLKRHQTSKSESCHINHQWPKSLNATGKVKYQTFPETSKLKEVGIAVVILTCVHSLQASKPIFAPSPLCCYGNPSKYSPEIHFSQMPVHQVKQAGK